MDETYSEQRSQVWISPELTKCYLVVASEFIEEATQLFSQYEVNIVQGQRFLGGFVGDEVEANKWASLKINSYIRVLLIG